MNLAYIWSLIDDPLFLICDGIITAQYFVQAVWFSKDKTHDPRMRQLHNAAVLIGIGFLLRMATDFIFIVDSALALSINRTLRALPALIFITWGALLQRHALTK